MIFPKVKKLLYSKEERAVFKGMATLFLGSGAAKMIGLVSVPLLTRIYSPEDFGVLTLYASTTAILSPFLTLRYSQAIPLPRTDNLASNIVALSLILILTTSAILAVLIHLTGTYILTRTSMDRLVPWTWLIILGCIGASIYETFSMWATRKKDYRIIAKTQLTQSLIGTSIKIALGILGHKPFGLLLGHLASLCGGSSSFMLKFKTDVKSQIKNISWKRIRLVARYYSGYPTMRLPSQVVLALSTQAPPLLLTAFYNTQTTGQLGLALSTLALPVNLLSESMSKAFYAEISGIGRKHPHVIQRLTYYVIQKLFWLSLVPALILVTSGEWIFTRIFGTQWAQAGQFAAALSIYMVFQFIQKPVSYLMFVFDGQKTLLYLNTQRAIITFSSLAFCHWLNLNAVTSITVYAFSLSAHYIFSIVLAVRRIPSTPK